MEGENTASIDETPAPAAASSARPTTQPSLGLRAVGLKKLFQGQGPALKAPSKNSAAEAAAQESFGGVHDVDFEIPQGEGFSLLGPSGCGKTTTLRMIGGFETPDSGRLHHRGQDITDLPPQKRNIRTVFQRYALFPHLSVFENIAFGLRMQKRPDAEVQKRVKDAAELIEITHLLSRRILKLSGGEQQRVALARALVTEPDVLLLDEPLSALDLKLRERMQMELLSLRRKLGSTFIFVTHDQGEAMVLSDRIGVMRAGRLEQVGSPEEIYSRPKTHFVASFIGQANFLGREQLPLLKGDVEQLPALKGSGEWMIRPENLIARNKSARLAAGYIGFKVRVLNTAFIGQDRLSKVVDATGRQYLVKSPGFEPPIGIENEEILIAWETEDTWAVDS